MSGAAPQNDEHGQPTHLELCPACDPGDAARSAAGLFVQWFADGGGHAESRVREGRAPADGVDDGVHGCPRLVLAGRPGGSALTGEPVWRLGGSIGRCHLDELVEGHRASQGSTRLWPGDWQA
ncbi:DUF6300 family protein [Streptomyces sp. NPDC018584]|uniref:DUF6300 family protein n=1 Tax=unclassified Streptomyces TaxID=2593676 RepID=UPI003789E54D